MSDRIHSIVSAVAKGEDPASMILAIRKVLRDERDEGYDAGADRGRLGEIAATMKEANEAATPVCPKCGTAGCLEDKALSW